MRVVWATAAAPPTWPAASGLAVDGGGFIAVDATLQSTSHPGVFAAGDVALRPGTPAREGGGVRRPPGQAARGQPAAGASRQEAAAVPPAAPVPEPDQHRRPGYAIASRGRWSAEGAWVWRWKDRIDRRFMRRFANLPEMDAEAAGARRGAGRTSGPGAAGRRAGAVGGRHALRRLRVEGGRHTARPGYRPVGTGAPGRT